MSIGSIADRYELLEELGRGGMGAGSFARVWTEGGKLRLDEAVARALRQETSAEPE